jgi:peptide/nickel transport system substrate-binding protein
MQNGGISKGGLTYTFTLKHTEWSNGTPFTSADVVATWKLITSPGYVPISTVGWTDIRTIHVINPYKFQVILKTPFQPLLDDCFATSDPGIVPAQVFAHLTGKAAVTAAFGHDPTITNGPFEFQSWVPGTSITVVPNPHWFGPKPKAKKIVFEIVPSDSALLTDIESHSINVFWFAPIEDLKSLEAVKGGHVYMYPLPDWEAADVNMRDPFLDNVKVREALEMAIDRQALVSKVWAGHATLIGADQTTLSWAHNPALKPLPYDPSESRKLLAEAGFKMGSNGYLEKDGKEFTITYASTSGDPFRALDEELIQVWFRQIGVNMKIDNVPANVFFGTLLPSGKTWDLAEYESGDGGTDAGAAMYSSFDGSSLENYGQFKNAALDKLLAEQQSELTQAQRQVTLRKAEVIIAQQLPALFLYSPDMIAATQGMSGYDPNPWTVDDWNSWDWSTKG